MQLLLKTPRVSDPREFGTQCFVLEVLRKNTDTTVFLSVNEGIKYIKTTILINGVENAISFRYSKLHS